MLKKALSAGMNERQHLAGQLAGTSRGANLIANHAQRFALLRQPQHGLDKIPHLAHLAGKAVEAAGADDEKTAATGGDRALTCQPRFGIDGDGPGLVALNVRRCLLAIEDIIG